MSFCPIDEAFGSYMTQDLTHDPLESAFKPKDSKKCPKNKKKRINCNRRNTNFTNNSDDLFLESPPQSDDDADFNECIEDNDPLSQIGLYSLNASNPISSKKCKKPRKKTPKNTSFLNSLSNDKHRGYYTKKVNKDYDYIEPFENYNNSDTIINVKKSKKKNKKSNKKVEINEIYEHSEEDDEPLESLNNVHVDTDSEIEETKAIFKENNFKKNKNNKSKKEVSSQISEINSKINFIMNQLSNKDGSEVESEYNNINDIILFVLFGIFVLIIIESLYRLITKLIKANSVLYHRNNLDNVNTVNTVNSSINRGNTKTNDVTSKDTLDMITEYLKNSKSKN